MAEHFGVMVYEILPDGCLNGIGSDNHPNTNNKIFNEIARKKDGVNNHIIEGDYTCSYMNLNGKLIIADLEISNLNGQYNFNWLENGKKKYKGFGWRTRENQVTVYYKYL